MGSEASNLNPSNIGEQNNTNGSADKRSSREHFGKPAKFKDRRSLMAQARKQRIRKQISDHFKDEDFNGKFKFKRTLGKGSYGYVCEARSVSNSDQKVAVKKVEKVFENRTEAKRMLRELRLLRMLKGCPEIVNLLDLLAPKDLQNFSSLMIVFEFVDTDLSRLFSSNQYFSPKHVPYILYQILLGCKFMHSAKIAHRDLKPANILINEDCSIRICDFGLARSLVFNEKKEPHPWSHDRVLHHSRLPKKRQLKRELTRHVVTRWYRAPEVILLDQKFEFMEQVDMWSVGCIFAELLMMEQRNVRHYRDRKPLFPGSCSYPLSPPVQKRGGGRSQQTEDQLKVIFNVIGTPSKPDIESFQNENIKKYLERFRTKPKMDWKTQFPGSSDSTLQLLDNLLQFDRKRRYTVDNCLEHEYLAKNRDHDREKSIKPQIFEFEDIALTADQIREMIVDEVLLYNPQLAAEYKLTRTDSLQHLKPADTSPVPDPEDEKENQDIFLDTNNAGPPPESPVAVPSSPSPDSKQADL